MFRFPFTRDLFLEEIFERRPWLGEAVAACEVSWGHIEDALFGWDPLDGLIRLYKGGLIEPGKYSEVLSDLGVRRGRIMKDRLVEYLDDGATLILNRLELKSKIIEEYTREIGLFVGEKTVANGYASFGGKGAFDKHWDTHDVFAVQLIGQKCWKIYQPTFELPLPHQKSKGRKEECPAEPFLEKVLYPGDVLYIPRGWWHSTHTPEGQESFHIAVGVHVVAMQDYALWVCANVMPDYISSRRSIKFESDAMEVGDFMQELSNQLSRQENLNAFKELFAGGCRNETAFSLGRRCVESHLQGKRLRLNSPYLQKASSGVVISNGVRVNMDPKSASFIDGIVDGGQKVDLSLDGQALRLIRSLIDKDVLSVVEDRHGA